LGWWIPIPGGPDFEAVGWKANDEQREGAGTTLKKHHCLKTEV